MGKKGAADTGPERIQATKKAPAERHGSPGWTLTSIWHADTMFCHSSVIA